MAHQFGDSIIKINTIQELTSGNGITISNTVTLGTPLSVASGGTGQTSYTNGQLLIGNTTGSTLTKATLTGTSNQITVTNGAGSITLATPQDIHTAASPTFAGLSLGTGALNTVGSIIVDGTAARTVSVARATSGNGNTLTIQSGGGQSGATDASAGDLILATGVTTGTGTGQVQFHTTRPTTTGSSDQAVGVIAYLGNNGTLSASTILSIAQTTTFSGAPFNNSFIISGQRAGGFGALRQTTANTAGNNVTVQAGGATTSATDKAGGDLILVAGISTGTGVSKVKVQTYTAASSSGTSSNTAVDRIVLTSPKILTDNSAVNLVSCTIASNSAIGGLIRYNIEVTDGTDYQSEAGYVIYNAVNKAGTVTRTITEHDSQQAVSAGTLTTTWAISAASPAVISVNADTSLTASTGYPRITFTVENYGQQAIAIQ